MHIMLNYENRSARQLGVSALAVVSALLVYGCSLDSGGSGSETGDYSVDTAEDGSIRSITKLQSAGSAEEGASGDLNDKAGCVHIRFCNEKGPREVVCDTNDKPCTSQQRFDECIDDADAVCGNWQMMSFDPPIPL